MVKLFGLPSSVESPSKCYPVVRHSQQPVGCETQTPLQTNNTFNNLLLADQTFPAWPLPYSVWVARDGTCDFGVALNHTDRSQLVFGPDPAQDPAQYYFNPPKIKSFCFTAKNWKDLNLRVFKSSKLASSIRASGGTGTGMLTMHLVYGMGFVTGIYENERPVIHSAVGVQEFRKAGNINGGYIAKYTVKLFNQVTWSLYVSADPDNEFALEDPNHIVASNSTRVCVVQLARGESSHYDACAGCFPCDASLSGEVDRKQRTGSYSISYSVTGASSSGVGLVFALPHMQSELSNETRKSETGITLDSPTKGIMKGYTTNCLKMELQDLPFDISFEPWTSIAGFQYKRENYDHEVSSLIKTVALSESQQDVAGLSDVDSMYFGGKTLDKFAYIAYVAQFILRDPDVLNQILPKVKSAVEKYARNQQKNPLVYDCTWKGIISSATAEQDFGNSNYNDHHFHYGYHIHAIALIAYIDPRWLDENGGLVRNYAFTLVRDYANPSDQDRYFPQSRNFDWFHGHSFAHGIFPSGDGKNEESSSEDYHSIYALKLLGKVLNDDELESRASLMLAIMKDSINRYMLYSSDNKDQPKRFMGNKVSGILFENKIDFATFFGRGNVGNEFIHGIHMIPITPISSYIRSSRFVKEEWDAKLAKVVNLIPDGWRGLLILNQGLFDPRSAYRWFSRRDWQDNLIDPGMSRTWSLAYLAGIGGAKS